MLQKSSWDSNSAVSRSYRVGVQDICLALQSSRLFLFALPLVFVLILLGIERAQKDELIFPTLLFIAGGVLSLISFRSRSDIARPIRGEFRQIEIEQNEIEKLIRKLENDSEARSEKIYHDIYRFFLSVVNSGSSIVSSEISAGCAVSVKLLWREADGEITVRRLIRDSNSRQRRLFAPEAFPWLENTAFKSIAQSESDYFVSDNLSLLAAQGKHVNINEHWSELYNSTAVVPIKSRSAIIGFVCIDSWYGKLSGIRVKPLIEHLASHVYTGL